MRLVAVMDALIVLEEFARGRGGGVRGTCQGGFAGVGADFV